MNQEKIIELCINEAYKAYQQDDVPIGAVLVQNGQILSYAHNNREKEKDILGHAEILAIQKGAKKLNRWNLSDCDLYVTLEPCSMCKEVIKQSRIASVFYLTEKNSWKKEYNKTQFVPLNDKNNKQRYEKMISEFFQTKR